MNNDQELGIENYALKDLIDLNLLRNLTQHFYDVTGFAIGLIDKDGEVLISVGWQEICTEFHRKNKLSLANCRESDRHIENELDKGNYVAYKCKNGLVDVAVPIIIEGTYLASIFFGQFFWKDDKPAEEEFRKQAKKFNFDEESYIAAYRKIKTYSPEKVDHLMKFYRSLVGLITDMAVKNLKLSKSYLDALNRKNQQLQEEVEERAAVEEELRATNEQLSHEINERQASQEQNEKLIGDLGERVKEINCLNRINTLIDNEDLSMDEVFRQTVNLLPASWQYPADTCCRISIYNKVFESVNFVDKGNRLTETIYRHNEKAGEIEVVLQPGDSHDSNFLKEEVKLLENIASILSNAVTREYVLNQLKIKDNAFHNSINGFALADLSGYIIDVNPKFSELWGLDKKEAKGMFFADLLDDSVATQENMTQLKARGYWRGEIKARRKNGDIFDVEITSNVVINDKGEPIALSSSFNDISRRKRTAIELENALIFNKTVVVESPMGKLAYDSSGQCILANPKAAELVGATTDELLAQNFNLLDSWKKSGLKKAANEVLKTGKNQTIEIRIENTFKKLVWFECHFTRFYQLGEPHLMMVFSDVTINRMAQMALRESEQRLTLATEAANAGIWDWKINTNEVYFSRQWKQQLGYREEELQNEFSTWENLLHPDDRDAMLQKVSDFLDNPRGAFIAEFRLKHKDGSYRWIHNHASGIKDKKGNLIRMFGAHTDITEKVETLQKLEKNEKRFRTLVQATAQIVWLTTPDGLVESYLESWGKFTGQKVDEMTGSGWLEAIHPDDREQTRKAWFKAVREKTLYQIEHRIRRHDGLYRHFYVRGVPLLDNQGNITEWIGTHTDITERKNFEQALSASEEQHRRIFESVTDAIFICDTNGNIVETNPAATRIYGYSNDEFLRLSPVELVHPDYRRSFGEMINTVKRGDAFYGETVDITKAGRHINSQVIGTTLLFNGRKHIMVIIRDITEEKKAREEIDRFFNITLELLCIAGTDGYFRKINPLWKKLLGYSEEELLSKPFIDFVHPEDIDKTIEETKKLASGNITINFVNRFRCKDGTFRWLNWNTTPFGNKLYSAATDITELKETEDELKKLLYELERSNKELEQFAYIASHDLQEPLRMVTGFLQLLEKRYSSKLGDDAREFIGFAVDGAARMKNLINDLLKYSRVGTRAKPFEPTELNEILKLVEQNLHASITETEAHIHYGELPKLDADNLQMIQLFQNLIGNAIKFRSEKTPEIHIGAKDENEFWLISVADNGIGIQREHWDRVFTIFQRLHNKDEYSGTGIGLAICKKIVERHRGKIWINSSPGDGTTFFFLLPKKQEN